MRRATPRPANPRPSPAAPTWEWARKPRPLRRCRSCRRSRRRRGATRRPRRRRLRRQWLRWLRRPRRLPPPRRALVRTVYRASKSRKLLSTITLALRTNPLAPSAADGRGAATSAAGSERPRPAAAAWSGSRAGERGRGFGSSTSAPLLLLSDKNANTPLALVVPAFTDCSTTVLLLVAPAVLGRCHTPGSQITNFESSTKRPGSKNAQNDRAIRGRIH